MHFFKFGETNRFSGQPLYSSSQRQMFPFYFLGILFTNNVLLRR